MDKGAMKEPVASTPAWNELEEWTRGRTQEWMQLLLVDEVTEFLGRAKHQRRGVDMQGYRNGYGKPRRLTMRSGTITVRRPRVRDLDERFESRLLPLFTRRTKEVRDLLPDLYLHGLASGDFELALSGLLGDQAALSASTVARAKERWQAEYSEWQQGRIEDEIVYLWLDGVYLKAGLEKERAIVCATAGGTTRGVSGSRVVRLGRGTIVLVTLDPTLDHEQQGVRPCVVVTDPEVTEDQRFPMVCVVPVTMTRGQGASIRR